MLGARAPWELNSAPLPMSVVSCLAAGLPGLFGTLAFVHVRVSVDSEAVELRCGHAGGAASRSPTPSPRRRRGAAASGRADLHLPLDDAESAARATRGHLSQGARLS
ncbi:hypothetical protein [Streptomyces bathyalis]|uniref:hypothetical protein n=1 Tax=Streptomyces bathyalis TaxID=2710756 RepID=UPI001A9C74D1|nr:hypothetical protein [Streptomyces bathyalis]